MMNRATSLFALACALVAAATAAPHLRAAQAASDHVEIDAVVVDERGQSVEGLTGDAFHVEDDGKAMSLDSFEEVGGKGRPAARIVVLILDDNGVPSALTTRVQTIARLFANRAVPGDRISVVRLNSRNDEATGDRELSLSRIADYRAGLTPFFGRETLEDAMKKVRELSTAFEQIENRRKTIVAIGSPRTFDVSEPVDGTVSLLWPYWLNAVTSASRANVNLSVIDPAGITGRLKVTSGYGLVLVTGGDNLYNSASFEAAADRIWRDAGHYYLLGYMPLRSSRDLHDVEVTVTRPGLRVRARTRRG